MESEWADSVRVAKPGSAEMTAVHVGPVRRHVGEMLCASYQFNEFCTVTMIVRFAICCGEFQHGVVRSRPLVLRVGKSIPNAAAANRSTAAPAKWRPSERSPADALNPAPSRSLKTKGEPSG